MSPRFIFGRTVRYAAAPRTLRENGSAGDAVSASIPTFRIRELGRVGYEPTWRAMQAFTSERGAATPDELWLLEHPPVFTLGLQVRREHLLDPGDIPVIPADRGGQITYHGPGQVVMYTLVDLRRRGLGIRGMVSALEDTVITVLDGHGIDAHARREAPGVYVGAAKIASVGLRVRRGCAYHGIAFNVAMDLAPFTRINPCGYAGLRVIDLRELGVAASPTEEARSLAHALIAGLESKPSATVPAV